MKKIWIGGTVAIAIAIAIVVLQFGPGGKPADKDVVGTVMPAQRYRAEQPTGSDVQVVASSAAGAAKAGGGDGNSVAQSNSASQGSAAVQGPTCGSACRTSNSAAQSNSASQGSAAVQGPINPPNKPISN